MTIDSVEEENVAKLIAEKEKKQKELDIVKKKTIEQMWTEEINTLNIQYEKYQKIRKSKLYGDTTKVTKVKKVKKINKKKVKK